MMAKTLTAYMVMGGAGLFTAGALLCFGYSLAVGPMTILSMPLSNAERLGWDAGLSLLFFGVHSILIRRAVELRLTRFIPGLYYRAIYAIVSGIALFLVAFLWQPTTDVWLRLEGGLVWLPRGVTLLAIAGLAWVVRSANAFGAIDLFGWHPLQTYLYGWQRRSTRLLVRGPFGRVRHPLYALMLVLLWSTPNLTSDRALLNVLWTGWMVIGIYLEERDLVVKFGAAYRDYQRSVPMLIPWRPMGTLLMLKTVPAKIGGQFARLGKIHRERKT